MKNLIFAVFLLLLITFNVFPNPQAEEPIEGKKKIDFAVLEIKAGKCICELEGMNAFYMNKALVLVANTGAETEDAELSLKLSEIFPRMKRQVISKVRNLKPGERRWITVIDRPFIVIQKLGIEGSIKPLYPQLAQDTNRKNNKIKIYDCSVKSR